jgi:hypothetical protein
MGSGAGKGSGGMDVGCRQALFDDLDRISIRYSNTLVEVVHYLFSGLSALTELTTLVARRLGRLEFIVAFGSNCEWILRILVV